MPICVRLAWPKSSVPRWIFLQTFIVMHTPSSQTVNGRFLSPRRMTLNWLTHSWMKIGAVGFTCEGWVAAVRGSADI